jgi:hypothetical protein
MSSQTKVERLSLKELRRKVRDHVIGQRETEFNTKKIIFALSILFCFAPLLLGFSHIILGTWFAPIFYLLLGVFTMGIGYLIIAVDAVFLLFSSYQTLSRVYNGSMASRIFPPSLLYFFTVYVHRRQDGTYEDYEDEKELNGSNSAISKLFKPDWLTTDPIRIAIGKAREDQSLSKEEKEEAERKILEDHWNFIERGRLANKPKNETRPEPNAATV